LWVFSSCGQNEQNVQKGLFTLKFLNLYFLVFIVKNVFTVFHRVLAKGFKKAVFFLACSWV